VPYLLEALVFPAAMPWAQQLQHLPLVGLCGSPELVLLPLTGEVKRSIGAAPDDEPVLGFLELVDPVRRFAAELSAGRQVAYVHAEVAGGTGLQGSAGWRSGQIEFGPLLTTTDPADLEAPDYVVADHISEEAINQALRWLGVRRSFTSVDEFDTVGLGRHRWTADWLRP
jgi:hypothetical protein